MCNKCQNFLVFQSISLVVSHYFLIVSSWKKTRFLKGCWNRKKIEKSFKINASANYKNRCVGFAQHHQPRKMAQLQTMAGMLWFFSGFSTGRCSLHHNLRSAPLCFQMSLKNVWLTSRNAQMLMEWQVFPPHLEMQNIKLCKIYTEFDFCMCMSMHISQKHTSTIDWKMWFAFVETFALDSLASGIDSVEASHKFLTF